MYLGLADLIKIVPKCYHGAFYRVVLFRNHQRELKELQRVIPPKVLLANINSWYDIVRKGFVTDYLQQLASLEEVVSSLLVYQRFDTVNNLKMRNIWSEDRALASILGVRSIPRAKRKIDEFLAEWLVVHNDVYADFELVKGELVKREELTFALHLRGLELRHDSKVCESFIKQRALGPVDARQLTLEEVVDIAEYMNFLCIKTKYLVLMKREFSYRRDMRRDYSYDSGGCDSDGGYHSGESYSGYCKGESDESIRKRCKLQALQECSDKEKAVQGLLFYS